MSTPTLQDKLLDQKSPQQLLRVAIAIREQYVRDVAATKEKLDPKRLRGLDASIKRLRAALQ